MASVQFSSDVGGDNSIVSDDSDPTTGLKNGGHRTRFVAALVQFVAMCGFAKTQATAAAASAASALNAPGTSATSATNNVAIGTGSKTITLAQTGKAFTLGQTVVCSDTADATKQMAGVITAFNAATGVMTINSTFTAGAGTPAGWNVALSAISGVASVAGLSGVVSAAALKSALSITTADITDYASDQTTRANALKAFAVGMAVAL